MSTAGRREMSHDGSLVEGAGIGAVFSIPSPPLPNPSPGGSVLSFPSSNGSVPCHIPSPQRGEGWGGGRTKASKGDRHSPPLLTSPPLGGREIREAGGREIKTWPAGMKGQSGACLIILFLPAIRFCHSPTPVVRFCHCLPPTVRFPVIFPPPSGGRVRVGGERLERAQADWRFITEDTHIKLKQLYPNWQNFRLVFFERNNP